MARATILIVEGDASVRRSLREALARQDYLVFDTSTGAAAVALAAKHRPDLILLDMSLRNEDGLALAKRLHARMETVPLVVALLTAKHHDRAWPAEISRHCFGRIVKPIRPSHLPQDIARFLRLARRQTPPGATMADDYPKRRHPRFTVALNARCRLQGGGTYVAGVVRTLSEGGLLLEFPRRYSPGRRIEIRMETEEAPLHILGEVVWGRPRDAGKRTKPIYRLGLRLVRLTEQLRTALRRFLSRRLPA